MVLKLNKNELSTEDIKISEDEFKHVVQKNKNNINTEIIQSIADGIIYTNPKE